MFAIMQLRNSTKNLLFSAVTLGIATLLRKQGKLVKGLALYKKRVVITGGSRGLGFALAEQYLRQGAKVVLCARSKVELGQARKKLIQYSSDVHTFSCDLTDPLQVKDFAQKVRSHFGKVDVLINNAGIMEVGPLDSMTFETIQNTIDVNLISMIRVTLDFLPFMPKKSRIINITSIGGAVAVPHLLPYTVSKFGALGFSLGLDSELSSKGISVTTVLLGLMRTGSFTHANFSGNALKEFDWFALAATMPLLSISATRAAKEIISSAQRRKRFVVLGPQAKFLRILYHIFPEFMLSVMRIAIRFLPDTAGQRRIPGSQLRQDLRVGGITRLGDRAGDQLNEGIAS